MTETPVWIQVLAVIGAVTIAVLDFFPVLRRALDDYRVSRNRAHLMKSTGLTPARYIATISPLDYQSYAEAVYKFWPRRDRHERRDAMLDQIGKIVGPTGAKNVSDLKATADRLDGRSS